MSISSVESMYRWINSRHASGGAEARGTDTTEPSNYPDSLCNGKHFIFVHGFNATEQAARGWNAEVFKRMYWSGSHAMYTAVTWEGDETPGVLPAGAYYHADVIKRIPNCPLFSLKCCRIAWAEIFSRTQSRKHGGI